VPVILITYATSEDAVYRALQEVQRDKVIRGRPQVIRIEKTDARSERTTRKTMIGRPQDPAVKFQEYADVDHISVPPQLLLERILTLEIVRVTERAAVSQQGFAATATRRRPTRPRSMRCAANSTSCRSKARW